MPNVSKADKQIYEFAPSNPTGTTSTASKVMMGLNGAFTPQGSSRIRLTISCDVRSGSAGGGVQGQMRYGTGTAPTNGAADTGTSAGGQELTVLAGTTDRNRQVYTTYITGLVAGTTYWFDLAIQAVTSGTATLFNCRILIEEV